MPADAKTPGSSSTKSREHNQGRQDRDFTPEQKSAVDRVRKCKPTAYYEILDIKVEATDGDVKKAYRRLALVMHPDKNGAPGADEAFKMVSRAFQVLSDPQKRAQYDRTGGDPDSRFGGGSSSSGGGGGTPFGNGFGGVPRGGQMFTDEISPEDLFNMFFGGGGLGGGFQGGIFADGPGFMNFGGPGIRIHQFGGPRVRRRAPGGAGGGGGGGADGAAGANDIPPEEPNLMRTITQLLPLILLFILPIISSLWSDASSSYPSGPQFKFHRSPPYTLLRTTPKHKIPYYVDPTEITEVSTSVLSNLGHRVEVKFLNDLSGECNYEMAAKQRQLEEARGWFFADPIKEKKAREISMPNCDRLRQYGYQPGYRY